MNVTIVSPTVPASPDWTVPREGAISDPSQVSGKETASPKAVKTPEAVETQQRPFA
jgi:hypothetical protein